MQPIPFTPPASRAVALRVLISDPAILTPSTSAELSREAV